MPSEWRDVRLADVADEVTVGYVGPMAAEYTSQGVPFLRSKNIRPHAIDLTDVRFISSDFHLKIAKSRLAPGDVVTVRTGKPGTTAVIPDSLPVANCSDLVITRTGPELDPRWLSYFINGAAGGYIESRLVGAVQQHFNIGSAKEMLLHLPPLNEQRSIAATLGSLDEKIDSNVRAVWIQRELATAMLLDVSKTQVRLGDVASLRKGLSYKGEGLTGVGEGIPMVNMGSAANFGWLKRDGFKYYKGEFKPRHIAEPGALIITGVEQTWKHEIIGWPLLVPEDVGSVLFTHHMILVDFNEDSEWMRLPLWAHLFSPGARASLESLVYGTTVATLPVSGLESLTFTVPDPRSRAIPTAESLLMRAWALERESEALARLRNTLLPELLSGRLRVSDTATVT